jgi:PAS domain S-box-containing protein
MGRFCKLAHEVCETRHGDPFSRLTSAARGVSSSLMPVAKALSPVLRSLVESHPLPAAAMDHDLVIVAHNHAFTRTFAIPDDVVGQKIDALFPEIPVRWRDALKRALSGEAQSQWGERFDRADGRTQFVSWTLQPWSHDDGSIGGVILASADVTEQAERERTGREQQALVRAFFDGSPFGLNLCRTDGLWLESNPAFLRTIGYTAEEADGSLTYWQLTPRKYDDAEAEQLLALERTGRYGPYEKEFIRKDGSLVPVRLQGFFVERDGERYIWSIIEDLSAQRELEQRVRDEQLRAIQASKLATIGEMAAGFAHEINNPLCVIDAYAFELGADASRDDPTFVPEAVDAIRASVARAAQIVAGLRKLSRTEHDTPVVPLDVTAHVIEALELCRPRLRTHGIDIETSLLASGRVAIRSVELVQVIINLLNNAFDAVRAHLKRQVRIESFDDGANVCVAVIDSGPPLTAEVRDRLFEPFFTTKPTDEGTGLGLGISRSIAVTAGGTLEYDAHAPMTRFVLTLPRAPEAV